MKIAIELDVPDPILEPVIRSLIVTRGNLTIAEASELVHLSHTRFSSEFRRLTGISFRSARVRIKTNLAAHLLLATDLRVSEIANHLGYSEPRKLKQIFKKNFGLSPIAYRRKGGAVESTKKFPFATSDQLNRIIE